MAICVVVERLASDPIQLQRQFEDAFISIGIHDKVNSAKAVLIKPNLTFPAYKQGVTTRAEYVEGLVATLRRINASTKIFIGEGEGGYNSFSMTDAMREMGYYDIASKFPLVEIVNLSKLPRKQVELVAYGRPYLLDLPSLFFEEIDFSITCPLPKVHCMTGISLAFKNQWGCLPDIMRLKNHYVFDEIIGQICEKLKFRYAFLDGKYGLNINGPMMGEPVELDWFVASNSLCTFDMTVSGMMGFDWTKIRHLRKAVKYNCVPKREDIEIIGDIEAFKRKFVLKRNFWNYVALGAFYSRYLTHLFYFSKLSGPLHDIMYSFREKPIIE